jgi:hypothetical protein
MFEAGRLRGCQQGAAVLSASLVRLAVARKCRTCAHASRAGPPGAWEARGTGRAALAKRLGISTRWRQQPRARQALDAIMGGEPEVETGEAGPPPTAAPRSGPRILSSGPRPRCGASKPRGPPVDGWKARLPPGRGEDLIDIRLSLDRVSKSRARAEIRFRIIEPLLLAIAGEDSHTMCSFGDGSIDRYMPRLHRGFRTEGSSDASHEIGCVLACLYLERPIT